MIDAKNPSNSLDFALPDAPPTHTHIRGMQGRGLFLIQNLGGIAVWGPVV